jgi:hypothetical protein
MRRRNYLGQSGDQFWAAPLQFPHPLTRKFFDHSISASGKFYVDDSVVGTIVQSPQQAHARQTVNALNDRVVLHQETSCQMLNRGAVSRRHSANREEQLKLFGFQAGGTGGLFAFRKKQPDAEAEFRQRTIVGFFKL